MTPAIKRRLFVLALLLLVEGAMGGVAAATRDGAAIGIAIAGAIVLAVFGRSWVAATWERAAGELSDQIAEGSRREHAAEMERSRGETAARDEILSSLEDAVILTVSDRVAYANRAAHTFFGVREDGPLPPQIPKRRSDQAEITDITVRHPLARELRVIVTPEHDGRCVIVARDVTDIRRLDRMRSDFVANASHEMKTPVAAILATAETLEQAIEDDLLSARRFTRTLGDEARRLSQLISDLLSLARLEEPIDEADVVDMSAVVRILFDEMMPASHAAHIEFTADIGSSIVVCGRGDDLRLLTRNLIDNALRYTPAGGSVSVTLAQAEHASVLTVIDTGAGIPQKDLPRVFERFFRVDQARARNTGGTGLGLAIVRHIAENHGGTVEVRSQLGTGSTFTVTLPSP